MTSPSFITTNGRKLAYHKTEGAGPGILFLGGLMSDMEGTKAVFLENWARAQGRAFVRFDYSGHGQSSGKFTEGCIGDWAEDAQAILEQVCEGPQVLVGSSMGGWVSMLLCKRVPDRITGFVGIAAAPDFTEDRVWASFDEAQKQELAEKGIVHLPSDYGDPYPISKRLIEDGRDNLVLRESLACDFPVRLVQGTADSAVDQSVPLRILEHLDCTDLRLTLVKGADHSFSTPDCLELIAGSILSLG